MGITIKRDLVDEYLDSASAEFTKKAEDLIALRGDSLTLLEMKNLRNSIFTDYVSEFVANEVDNLSQDLFIASLGKFVEMLDQQVKDNLLNDFSILK